MPPKPPRKTPTLRQVRKPDPLYIGQWLRRWELQAREVATAAGISESYLSQLMNPKKYVKKPSREWLRDLADGIMSIKPGLKFDFNLFYTPPPSQEAIDQVADLPQSVRDSLLKPNR